MPPTPGTECSPPAESCSKAFHRSAGATFPWTAIRARRSTLVRSMASGPALEEVLDRREGVVVARVVADLPHVLDVPEDAARIEDEHGAALDPELLHERAVAPPERDVVVVGERGHGPDVRLAAPPPRRVREVGADRVEADP